MPTGSLRQVAAVLDSARRHWNSSHPSSAHADIVTGDRLEALADVSLVPAGFSMRRWQGARGPRLIQTTPGGSLPSRYADEVDRATVIFVYGHEAEGFLERVLPALTPGKVLISHNSDHPIAQEHVALLEQAGPRLVRWFAQNVTAGHDRLMPLPIGIANALWPHGDLAAVAAAARVWRERPKEQLLHARFDPTTFPTRHAAWEAVSRHFPHIADRKDRPVGFRRYLDELGRHRFAACPRGNGIDTFRMWEALYLGVVPIVERSAHAVAWERTGLPLLLVDDWDEVTPELLTERDRTLPRASPWERLPPPLRLSSYAAAVREARSQAVAMRSR